MQVGAILLEDQDCTELVAAVGEASYQGALTSVCGSRRWEDVAYECIAGLLPEPDNPHDPNAVQVQVNGLLVGYLSRGDAIAYRPMIDSVMASGNLLAAKARIAGRGPGSDTSNVGIFLKLPQPDEPIELPGG